MKSKRVKLCEFESIKDSVNSKKIYSFINLASISEIYKDSRSERDILYGFDGGLTCCLYFLLTGRKIKRSSFDFTSIAGGFFDVCEQESKRVYFVGGSSNEINVFVEKIKARYPSINIVGFDSGFHSEEGWCDIYEKVSDLKPDLVVAGLGAGLQEDFLFGIRKKYKDFTGITCGGFIRQESASENDYYPKMLNFSGGRAVYRMFKEPHTVKRYMIDYPKNTFLLILLYALRQIKFEMVEK